MNLKTVIFLLSLCALGTGIYSQEVNTIPEALRRPERGEAPRYPIDVVIGELGRGKAPDGAYLFAKDLLSALTMGSREAQVLSGAGSILTESLREEIDGIEPIDYRLGGGRIEPDGCVSFMVRFIGTEQTISGELFLRRAETSAIEIGADPNGPAEQEGSTAEEESIEASEIPVSGEKWILDDLVLEDVKLLNEIGDSYRFDFSPYERFY